MIEYRENGDLFAAETECIVNTVNTVGSPGKGLAKQFAERFPAFVQPYKAHCASGKFRPGDLYFQRLDRRTGKMSDTGDLWILNIATKDHWYDPSKLEWV